MKKNVLFIHGAGEGAYKVDRLMVESLRDSLGFDYEVHYPRLNEESPEFEDWASQIASELVALEGDVTLVGHSVGGSVLIKFLTEKRVEKPIASLLLLAAPFWGTDEFWKWDAAQLPEDVAATLASIPCIFLYHSRDDNVVPFTHLALYAAKLPKAILREVDGRGHQFGNDLADIAEDITQAGLT